MNKFLKVSGIKEFCSHCHGCCPANSKKTKYCYNSTCVGYLCDDLLNIIDKLAGKEFKTVYFIFAKLKEHLKYPYLFIYNNNEKEQQKKLEETKKLVEILNFLIDYYSEYLKSFDEHVLKYIFNKIYDTYKKFSRFNIPLDIIKEITAERLRVLGIYFSRYDTIIDNLAKENKMKGGDMLWLE